MSDERLGWASLIVFVAFFIRALTGFGAGLVAIPLLALMYPLPFVVPLQLLFELGISGLLLPKVWREVDWAQVGRVAAGMLVGNVSGSFLLASVAPEFLKTALIVVVLLFSGYLAWIADRPAGFQIGRRWGVVFGLVGGVFGGAFGMSGPLVVLYLSCQSMRKEVLRASLIGLFGIGSIWTLTAHSFNGLYSVETFRVAVWLLPAFLLATWLGHRAHLRVSEVLFRRVVAGILLLAGLLLAGAGI
ncbi:MAG: sulfite exporter TauE/SafE family protein [Verrucomicrobiae bacterium]|nr:sulfite exporter TauE/SafE family protein [Verrucomicrobiae bacterium]